jgi:hypothetical protein
MPENEYQYPRIKSEDDPDRCQGIAAYGQCTNVHTPNSKYCPIHGGNKGEEAAQKLALRNYRLYKFQERIQSLGDSSNIKSLRDEVAILRLMMEQRLNSVNDTTDLLLQSGPIGDLVMKIDRVVTSCHKLEGSMGLLLDKTAVLQFANVVIEIIGEELKDQPEVVSRIADRILQSLGNISTHKEPEQKPLL